MKPYLILLFLMLSPLYAGEKKAVLDYSETKGFSFREGVEDRLGVKVQTVKSRTVTLPLSAIVYSKDEAQIYRRREGYWKALDVHPKRSQNQAVIDAPEIRMGDEIAVQKAELLKVVDLQLSGGQESSHIH